MKKLKFYQVDAFANGLFTGNPAAVVILHNTWLPDMLMQKIAMENNLSETAFVLETGSEWHIRWFTPVVEVELCGHATLASAYVIFNMEGYKGTTISLRSKSGTLKVSVAGEIITLDFPTDNIMQIPVPDAMTGCFGMVPVECWKGKTDYMLVFEHEEQISSVRPDMTAIAALKARGIIITAPGNTVDFVSRFFGPQSGVPEDPVTGSAHTLLTPYWSKKLDKKELTAMQLSARKGWLQCRNEGDRTKISGKAVIYATGEFYYEEN